MNRIITVVILFIAAMIMAAHLPLANTRMEAGKKRLINMMEKGRMPRIGTTIVDEEALALIKNYLQSK